MGIPLIELATEPQIEDAEHAKEVAQMLGSILRASKVKRGLGTIRQDINVSIKDGARIEMKGVQDLRIIKKLVEGEVRRQVMLIRARDKLKEQGVTQGDYDKLPVELTKIFKGSESKVIIDALKHNGVVMGVPLAGLDSLLRGMIGPQIAQYARAMTGVKGIFHGDELPGYGISPDEVETVKKELGISGKDSFMIVAENKLTCEKAIGTVLSRCKIALVGVPVEVRRAKEDGSTEFMRPLPGSSRMYPETDEPLVTPTKEQLENIKASLPELREDRAKRYEELGLGKELASQLSKSGIEELFEGLLTEHDDVDATTVATLLTSITKEAAKRYEVDTSILEVRHYGQVLALVGAGKVSKNVLAELLSKACQDPEKDIVSIAEESALTNLLENELGDIIIDAVKNNPGLAQGPLMGRVMAQTKGRADPKKVAELLKKAL